MRRGVVLALLLALPASLTACGSSARDKVNEYIKAANAIQDRAAPEFARANAAYKQFSQNKLANLHPPAQAKTLHRLLLHLFDLNIELAHETTLMGEYVPAATEATKPLK